jgi:hypothetical protein
MLLVELCWAGWAGWAGALWMIFQFAHGEVNKGLDA